MTAGLSVIGILGAMSAKRMARVLLLLLLGTSCNLFAQAAVQSQQAHSAYSQVFRQGAIETIDAIDAAYKSIMDRDPDSVYEQRWQDVQSCLTSLRKAASAKREKELLKLLYVGSNVIGMMHSCSNCSNDNYEFAHEAGIVEQCSTEARLKIGDESARGKLPRDFKSNQCLAQMDTLVRSIQSIH